MAPRGGQRLRDVSPAASGDGGRRDGATSRVSGGAMFHPAGGGANTAHGPYLRVAAATTICSHCSRLIGGRLIFRAGLSGGGIPRHGTPGDLVFWGILARRFARVERDMVGFGRNRRARGLRPDARA